MVYRVRVRNTSGKNCGTWATFVKAARKGAVPRVSQSELARRLNVDRSTVWRWETGQSKPENVDIVIRVADALDINRDEALAAAGFKPGAMPPQAPTLDEETELILSAPVDEDTRRAALDQLHRMRLRDKQRRMEDLEFFLRTRRRA